MGFDTEYQKIKNLVNDDLNFLENNIKKIVINNNPLDKYLVDFLTAPSKRLRPLLGFLFLRALFNELNDRQRDVLLAVELIHNATLIHDDIIDNAKKRRGKDTLNFKFDNNLAVVAGDFLLSLAMEKIIDAGSIEVIKMCTSALKTTCLGEIGQHFSKFKITSIDEYIEKSKEKTALLFEIGILSGIFLSDKAGDENLLQTARDFSQNFGIAFQIRDDLINILNSDKHNESDLEIGIYTAPVIFARQENADILKEKDILKAIKSTKGIEKTKNLMDNYFNASVLSIRNFEDSEYKKGILKLIELLVNL